REGAPRSGGGPRPGMPTPGIMRQHSHGGLADTRPSGRGGGRGRGGRPGGGPVGGGPVRPGAGPRGRGRRGSTQGAVGRGGKPARSRNSKRAQRPESEQLPAPAPGGGAIPRGAGTTKARRRRGAAPGA